ncbi:MAG: DsbA family protein [Anaerolineales bacterium]|jgi:protein-disulfide isomerase
MSKREELREKRRRTQQRNLLIGVLIVVGVAVIITAVVVFRTQAMVGNITMPEILDYPPGQDAALGDPNAPVRIDEFADFQCPACGQFHEMTMQPLLDTYIKTGKVYFVFHNYPFIDSGSPGSESRDAAMASMCAAAQGQFWPYHDMLFANQIGENVGSFTRPRLKAMAEKLGLDMSAFDTCLNQGTYQQQILDDIALAQQSEVRSTPSFLINGQLVVGAQPFSSMASLIEQALQTGTPTTQ